MTRTRKPVSTVDLDEAVSLFLSVLSPATDRDWNVKAGSLRWSCHRTAGHLGDTFLAYACQIISDYQEGWVPFAARVPKWVKPAGALIFVRTGADLLSMAAPLVDPEKLAFHPFGAADVEGFLAMATAETLVHGYEIAQSLELDLTPDDDLCGRLMNRLFPSNEGSKDDPWQDLLAATNRLPDRPGARRWKYHSSPLP